VADLRACLLRRNLDLAVDQITPVVVQIESFRRPLEGQIAGARLIGVGSYAVVVTPG